LTIDEVTLLINIYRTGRCKQQGKTTPQNLSKMEKQNTQGALPGLPLVGYAISNTHRKEPRRTAPSSPRFHDHLVLESKPHFMIILRLENADPRVLGSLATGNDPGADRTASEFHRKFVSHRRRHEVLSKRAGIPDGARTLRIDLHCTAVVVHCHKPVRGACPTGTPGSGFLFPGGTQAIAAARFGWQFHRSANFVPHCPYLSRPSIGVEPNHNLQPS
jgi:hypothetical protein